MAYLEGPLPSGALRAPDVTLMRADPDGVLGVDAGDLSMRGTVVRVVPGTEPDWALRVFLDGEDGVSRLLVLRTWAPLALDVASGRAVDVTLRRSEGTSLVLSDDRGALLALVAGTIVPSDQRKLPVQVYPTQDRVALEVSSGDDLCNRTWAHQLVEVAAGGREWLLAPGRSGEVTAGDSKYRISIAASRIPEEADCGTLGDREVAYSWTRVPREAASDKR